VRGVFWLDSVPLALGCVNAYSLNCSRLCEIPLDFSLVSFLRFFVPLIRSPFFPSFFYSFFFFCKGKGLGKGDSLFSPDQNVFDCTFILAFFAS